MKRPLAALALFAVLTGCSDGPVDPEPVLSLSIYRGSLPFEEETIRVGQTVSLEARVEDERGNPVDGGAVRWSSSDEGVAAVDAAGGVRGVAVGTALIVASADGSADTVRINVAVPLSDVVACAPGQAALDLAVGEVHLTNAYEARPLCLAGGKAGSEYTLVPFYASEVPAARLGVDVLASGVVEVAGPPSPSRAPRPPARAGLVRDDAFHLRLRDRVDPRAHRPARGFAGGVRASRALSLPSVGQELRFNVETVSADGCSNPDHRTGRVVAVSEHAIVVADVENPANGFIREDYEELAGIFDDLVHPVATRNFGEPSDIDGNGRAVVFYTRAVNELTPRGAGSYIGGFFYNRDLFSTTGENACAGSNEAEVFYLMVPDPRGEINGNVRSRDFVRARTVSVLAHELQHLINDSRRLLVNDAPDWEEKWLSEGLSHIAEELVFYEAAGLRPGSDLDPEAIRQAGAVEALEEYQHDNLERWISYLAFPENASLTGTDDDLPTRGAAWAFLRYAADRRGGDETSFWHALVRDARTGGLENLRAALGGTDPLDWMRDWTVSNYTDDAGIGVDARFTHPSWNFRELLPALDDLVGGRRLSTYPLRVLALADGAERSLLLQAGGAAYLRFGIAPGDQAALRATVGGGLPGPTRLRLAVVRTR